MFSTEKKLVTDGDGYRDALVEANIEKNHSYVLFL